MAGKLYQTPITALIDEYYRQTGGGEDWTPKRIKRLCRWLNLAPCELGAIFRISGKKMNGYLKGKTIYPPDALWLSLLESFYIEEMAGNKIAKRPVLAEFAVALGARKK